MEFDHARDIRESIAYPKRWQPKANPKVPYQKYPRIPYRLGTDKERGPQFFKTASGEPVIFKTARDEAEWLEKHPLEARQIAEYEESLTPAGKSDNAAIRNEVLEDELKRAKADRDQMEATAKAALDELETMKAQLRAKRAGENKGLTPEEAAATSRLLDAVEGRGIGANKLDMRTKEGRAAAAKAKEQVTED